MNYNEEIVRWEDIPKAKISYYNKKQIITSEFKAQSKDINNDWASKNNRSIRVLKNLYDSNVKKMLSHKVRTPHKNLYNLVCDKETLRLAYRKLSRNKGAMTPGAEDITATNINESFLDKLSSDLKKGKFKWNPARRIYIEKPSLKKNKKKRPLGINDFRNKIVQEAIRLVLEAIYEPEFMSLETNSGFRPKRDCANAIENIKQKAQFANIVIEGDIVGAFDSINHDKLISILKLRIKDKKLIKLIYESFKAGIIEERTYIDTNLGVPQGGICSPILFNIYMHNFDLFMSNDVPNFIESEDKNSGKSRCIKENAEYKRLRSTRKRRQDELAIESNKTSIVNKDVKTLFEAIRENKHIFIEPEWDEIMIRGKAFDKKVYKNSNINASVNNIKEEIVLLSNDTQKELLLNYKINKLSEEIKMINLKLKSTPHGSIENSKILMYYHRYADDWVLWLRCTLEFAVRLKNVIKTFLKEELEMELSDEKTRITIIDEDKVKFLGFSLYRNKNVRLKTRKFKNKISNPAKVVTRINNLRVDLDRDRLNDRFKINGFYELTKYHDRPNKLKPREIGWLSIFEIQQIIEKYNQFMLGLGNYYITVISEPSRLSKYIYILYYSCLKTLCCKLRISTKELTKRFGFFDISDQINPDYNLLNKEKKQDYVHSDIRICYNYEFNNEKKWIVLLNYKELMSKLLRYREFFQASRLNGVNLTTPNIDYFSMHKLNFRTRFKMTSHCIICGSNEQPLHNHHINKVSNIDNDKLKGYKAFDKLVASLIRKQITICHHCHVNIHNSRYKGLKLTDLYDVRLAIPENFIKMDKNSDYSQDRKHRSDKKDNPELKFIINKDNKTYWNRDYNEYLSRKEIKFKEQAILKKEKVKIEKRLNTN